MIHRFKKNNTIFAKIFKVLFLAITSFSLIFTLFTIINQKKEILDSLALESKSIAKLIEYTNSDVIVLDDYSSLIEFGNEFINQSDSLETIIISKDNNFLIINKDKWEFKNELNKDLLGFELKENKSDIIFSPILKKEVFHYTQPIILSGTHWGWIHLSKSLDSYNEKVTRMYLALVLFFSLLVLFSFFTTFLIAKSLAKPIIDLNDIAKKISKGRFSLRSKYISNDEIGQLSDSFNHMISTIEKSQESLKESHEKLEERVLVRTSELKKANVLLEEKTSELEELNKNLDKKVKDEVHKRMLQEGLLIQQSRPAAMGEMIGNIAHQWRQPLSLISTAATGIKVERDFGISNEEKENEKLDSIVRSSQYLSDTIEDFINFFKPNKVANNFTIEEMLEKSLALVDASLKFNYIEVEKNYQECNEVYGYAKEYSQAVLNILSNAKDALKERKIEDAKIWVSIYEKNSKAILKIEDNAGGIKQEIIDKVFDPYFTTKHQTQGTGVGLYMSKMIIEENMGGELKVENSKNGAIFTISLPFITVQQNI